MYMHAIIKKLVRIYISQMYMIILEIYVLAKYTSLNDYVHVRLLWEKL